MAEEKLYEVQAVRTSTAVRIVAAEDEREAIDAFDRLMFEGGAFFQSVEAELDFMDPPEIETECVGEVHGDPEALASPDGGCPEWARLIGTATEESGADRLAYWDRVGADTVREMRFGRIVARRWGGEPPEGFQGLQVGYYGDDGEFVVVAIVEEDRLDMRRETGFDPYAKAAFPMKWEFESQIQTLAFHSAADEPGRERVAFDARAGEEE